MSKKKKTKKIRMEVDDGLDITIRKNKDKQKLKEGNTRSGGVWLNENR